MVPPDDKKGARNGPDGLLSKPLDEVPGGMRSDVDLVNGLPPEKAGNVGTGAWPLVSKRKRKASLQAVADKAEEPIPPGASHD
jgi:hypothetical protein